MGLAKTPPKKISSRSKPSEHRWLVKQASGGYQCNICLTSFSKKKTSTFNQHPKSDKHRSSLALLNSKAAQSMQLYQTKKKEIKAAVLQAEIEISACIGQHTAIRNIDCLLDVFKKHASVLQDVTCKRTKATAIINEVIAPDLKSSLMQDLKISPFALLCDESTDISTKKLFTVTVRYIKTNGEGNPTIIDQYLGSKAIVRQTGEALWTVLSELISEFELNLAKCVGLSSDGAPNMVGQHNSLWSRFKLAAPHAILLKCTCHSYDLAIKHAYNHPDTIPSSFNAAIKRIPRWFSKSVIKRDNYNKIRKKLNPRKNVTDTSIPGVFRKWVQTRWLSLGPLLNAIKNSLPELRTYFQQCTILMPGEEKDTKFLANEILTVLRDPSFELYLVFLTSVVDSFERINARFQSTKGVRISELFDEMQAHYLGLQGRYKRGGQSLHPEDPCVDLGPGFNSLSNSLSRNGVEITPGESDDQKRANARTMIKDVRRRCFKFLQEADRQLAERMPENFSTFKNASKLSNTNFILTSHLNGGAGFDELPFKTLIGDENLISTQLREIKHINWASLLSDPIDIQDPIKLYWCIKQYRGSCGNLIFQELGDYLISTQLLPISNSFVETVFSIVTWLINKYRNRMKVQTLNSILGLKVSRFHHKACCKDVATESMVANYRGQYIYSFKKPEGEHSTEDNSESDSEEEEADEEEVMSAIMSLNI